LSHAEAAIITPDDILHRLKRRANLVHRCFGIVFGVEIRHSPDNGHKHRDLLAFGCWLEARAQFGSICWRVRTHEDFAGGQILDLLRRSN
jgi:hypothetical protein